MTSTNTSKGWRAGARVSTPDIPVLRKRHTWGVWIGVKPEALKGHLSLKRMFGGFKPIGYMIHGTNGIFTYIWLNFMVNVG